MNSKTMNENYNYIFKEYSFENRTRFGWINDCLLGDIQTFLDGIENFIQDKERFPVDVPRGGGNLSVPILISTALEFVSALYVGKTSYKDGNKYDATNNVKEFIIKFFPDNYKEFPLLFWDGIRNGIVHTFSPKPFEYQQNYIRYQFFVEEQDNPSDIIFNAKNVQTSGEVRMVRLPSSEQSNSTILIRINVFKLYDVLKKAFKNYQNELEIDESLQKKFVEAWKSIETYSRNIDRDVDKSKEARWLLSTLNKNNNYLLL